MMACRRQIACPIPLRAQSLPLSGALLVAVLFAACTAEPGPQPPRLAHHVEQLLDKPELLPTAASPTAADAPAEATPVAQPAAASPAVVQAAEPAAAPAAAPDAGPAAPLNPPAAEPVKAAEPAKGAEPAKVAEPVVAKAERPEKVDKAEKAEKADKSDKTEKAERSDSKAAKAEPAKVEPAKTEPAKADGGVVVPEGADATDLYYSGKRKLEQGDLNGAINDLRASQQLRHSVRTLTLLGRAYFDAGQMGPAEKALKSAGNYDDAMLLLGQLYQSTGKSAQARKVYAQFLSLFPDHAKAEWVRKLLQAL